MIKTVLSNLASLYYPRDVDSISEYDKYVQSDECKRLKSKLNSLFYSKEVKQVKSAILNKVKNYPKIRETKDTTMESFDRCLSFKLEIVENKTLFQICINISLLAPYYVVYILKNNIELAPYRWIGVPVRDKKSEISQYKPEINMICDIVEEVTYYSKIPESIAKIKISDLSYADKGIGEFTIFNAFFLNDVEL
ncbi:hypothetical protein MHTCC0001_23490 [Flavobacteriaceae bacterium MHTCC 0001]